MGAPKIFAAIAASELFRKTPMAFGAFAVSKIAVPFKPIALARLSSNAGLAKSLFSCHMVRSTACDTARAACCPRCCAAITEKIAFARFTG